MNILMLGHSLIEFYDWGARYPEHNVMNLGVAGETVEGLLDRTGRVAGRHPDADLIFVMTGANNIAMDDNDFLAPFERILIRLKSYYPEADIYACSILPILFDWVTQASIRKINSELSAIAQRAGVRFLDLYPLFTKDGEVRIDYLLDDGVHLSDRGYEVWADVLEGIINEK